MSSYDVIVVGCGASGVSALATLARAGCNVLGLEAANRIGGRINTVEFGRGVVELGAEWIHGERPSLVYDLAVQNNVTIRKQYLDMAIHRSDSTVMNKDMSDELINYCFQLMENPPKHHEPLGIYITRNFREYISKTPSLVNDTDFIREFLEFMNLLVNNYEASNDWDDVTTASNYEELEGHQHWSWHIHGYRTLFDILLNKHKNGTGLPIDMLLEKEVISIQWTGRDDQKVMVSCKDGSYYTTEAVVVTVSLGVLKERHSTLFNPKLPEEKVNAIDCMSMGVMDKIIFAYDTIWWPSNLTFFGFVWRGVDKARVPVEDTWITKIYGFSSPLGSENSITLWTSGETAKLVETLPEDVVKRKCTELLRMFMGPRVTEPIAMIRSTWYSNPLTRGSYTFDSIRTADGPAARAALAAPLLDAAGAPRLLFAGEATNQKHFSTVHGAMETGIREAENILKSLGLNNSRMTETSISSMGGFRSKM